MKYMYATTMIMTIVTLFPVGILAVTEPSVIIIATALLLIYLGGRSATKLEELENN